MQEDQILRTFVDKIKQHFGHHLQKVVLFGSAARGDIDAESDYDLILIFDCVHKETEKFIDNLAAEILTERGKMFSTFIFTQKQLEEMRYEPFILNAQKEGVML